MWGLWLVLYVLGFCWVLSQCKASSHWCSLLSAPPHEKPFCEFHLCHYCAPQNQVASILTAVSESWGWVDRLVREACLPSSWPCRPSPTICLQTHCSPGDAHTLRHMTQIWRCQRSPSQVLDLIAWPPPCLILPAITSCDYQKESHLYILGFK
jgi:hypothetical protein